MRKTALIITALMLIVGFSNAQTYQFAETFYDNGMPKVIKTFKESKGKFELVKSISLYENGQKSDEDNYKDGKRDGKWADWRENGQKEEEGTHKDGKRYGKWTFWYKNGQKSQEETYEDGEEIERLMWYENGQKKSEETKKNGKPDGKWTNWYENGQKKSEITWKGEIISEKCWNENGNEEDCLEQMDELEETGEDEY